MAKSTNKRSYRKHRKTRRNRRQNGGTNASNTVSKKQVATKSHRAITKIPRPLDNIYMTLPEIHRIIETTNKEYCGYIDRAGKYVLTDIGPEKTETSRGTCNQVKVPIIWHTHSSASKYYPSIEDINKILKHNEINISKIFTQYGDWTMEYQGASVDISEQAGILNETIFTPFYNATGGGRDNNPTAISALIISLNTYLRGQFGINGFITWNPL